MFLSVPFRKFFFINRIHLFRFISSVFKIFIPICFFVFGSLSIKAQTQTQESLIKEFFTVRGLKLINQWGLQAYSGNIKSYSINIINNTISVEIKYNGKLNDDIAHYSIGIDNNGNFTFLNYKQVNIAASAFNVCDSFKSEFLKTITDDDRNDSGEILTKISEVIGKAQGAFSCKDNCLYALYYYWVKDGYYKAYN